MPAPAPRKVKVLAAYYRLLGYTQEDAGKEIRRNGRTVRRWEEDNDEWASLCAEAQALYLKDVIAAARNAVIKQIKGGDGDLGFKILERNEIGFEPPAQRLKLGMDQDEAEEVDEGLATQIEDMEHRYLNGSATTE